MEEILKDIINDTPKALEMLLKVFRKDNGIFNDLYKEFISKPNNFEISDYRKKLRLFVLHEEPFIEGIISDNVPNEKSDGPNNEKEDFIYKILRQLNFNHQVNCFKILLGSKDKLLVPFVIRNKPNHGQRWLYNKLVLSIKDTGKDYHKPILLDLSKPKTHDLNSLVDFMLGDMSVELNKIPEKLDLKFRLLREIIKKRVETKYQIIIFKEAFSFAGGDEFEKFFNLLKDISEELELIKEKGNKCIVIFSENNEEAYKCRSFCFFTDTSELLSILGEEKLKLIDIYSNKHITENDLKDWFESNYSDLIEWFKEYIQDESKISRLIQDGNPEVVIKNLCKQMNVNFDKIEKQWLKH